MSERNRRTLMKFLAVGAIGFCADLAAFSLLRLAFDDTAARVLAIAFAVTITWVLNRRVTFGATDRSLLSEWLRYNVTSAAGAATNAVVSLAVLSLSAGGIGAPFALALGSVAALAVNYTLAKHFAFAPRRSS